MTVRGDAPQPVVDATIPEALAPRAPAAAAARSAKRPASVLVRVARWSLGILAIGAASAFAAPIVELSHGTKRARACLASIEDARGPALPDCRSEIRWFVTPSKIPWTAQPARYRAEELNARVAIAGYVDAIVGHPDAGAMARGADAIEASEKVLRAGSQRLVLEELGRAAGAPDLGRAAALLGDRRALIARFVERGADWTVWRSTLEGALIEGDVPRALAIAKRYAEFDPVDPDLRTAVAALVCLGGDGKRGMDLLETVQNDRADHKHEGWARNWGEVRAAILACSAKGKIAPAKKPERAEAGHGDLEEARCAQRLRLVARIAVDDEKPRRDAVIDAMRILRDGPRTPGARVRILAALIASGHPVDATTGADLVTPRVDAGEAPLVAPIEAMATTSDWLDDSRGLRPSVSGKKLRSGAARLRELASGDATSDEATALRRGAAATAIAAARALANEGDGDEAALAIDEAGDLALPSGAARALIKAIARRVAGDANGALAELDRSPAGDAMEPIAGAASLLARAEILASLGRRDEAGRAAIAADDAIVVAQRAAPDRARALDAHARWTRLALAPAGSKLRASPGSIAPAGAPRTWPWVGLVGAHGSWMTPEAEGPAILARALAFWSDARSASPDEKRALRYAALGHRGDAPRARAAYFALAAELLPEGDGDVEIWLDAFTITDARRTTLRAYAWSRAEAARLRGDAKAADRWSARHRALVKLWSEDEESAELAAMLGI